VLAVLERMKASFLNSCGSNTTKGLNALFAEYEMEWPRVMCFCVKGYENCEIYANMTAEMKRQITISEKPSMM
jgi:hypothetical protein